MRALDRIADDVGRQICSLQILFRTIPKHRHQRLIHLEKLCRPRQTGRCRRWDFREGRDSALPSAATPSPPGLVPRAGSFVSTATATASGRRTRRVLSTQSDAPFLINSSTISVSRGLVTRMNGISCPLFLQKRKRLQPRPLAHGRIRQDNVVAFPLQSLDEIRPRLDHIRRDGKLRPLELLQAKFHIGEIFVRRSGRESFAGDESEGFAELYLDDLAAVSFWAICSIWILLLVLLSIGQVFFRPAKGTLGAALQGTLGR